MIDYDPHDWRSHLCDVRGSMLLEIMPRVTLCAIWGVIVTYVHHRYLPVGVPGTAHTMAGTVLGLLLVFRTNASYDRFWEGRKQWGSITNECRNLARGASVHMAGTPELVRSLLLWTTAFTFATMNRLRGKADLGPIARRLPADEVRAVLAENHT